MCACYYYQILRKYRFRESQECHHPAFIVWLSNNYARTLRRTEMAIWHLTNAGYFRNNFTIRPRELGHLITLKGGARMEGMPILACRRSSDQPTNQTVSLSLSPSRMLDFPLPKTARSGQPGHFFCCTNHTHTIRGRAESESSPGRVEWFQADENF